MGSSDWRLGISDAVATCSSDQAQESALRAEQRVQHAPVGSAPGAGPPDDCRASCARCGGRLPQTRTGSVKRGVRYCSQTCRLAQVRERRATARAVLVEALAELQRQHERLRAALEVMGFIPKSNKRRKSDG